MPFPYVFSASPRPHSLTRQPLRKPSLAITGFPPYTSPTKYVSDPPLVLPPTGWVDFSFFYKGGSGDVSVTVLCPNMSPSALAAFFFSLFLFIPDLILQGSIVSPSSIAFDPCLTCLAFRPSSDSAALFFFWIFPRTPAGVPGLAKSFLIHPPLLFVLFSLCCFFCFLPWF